MDLLNSDKPYDVLALGAHPDDVEMAIGGTIAALCAREKRVAIVSLTRGELGTHGDAETRLSEAKAASEILGSDLRLLDMPDGAVVDELATRHRVARLIRELRPSVLLAPYPHIRTGPLDGRSNLDHIAAGNLANAGSKLARFAKLMPELKPHAIRRILYYMLPDSVQPSFVVDVSGQRATLERAIQAYASQMVISSGGRTALDFLMLQRQATGMRLGVELAEGFLSEDVIGGDAELLLSL